MTRPGPIADRGTVVSPTCRFWKKSFGTSVVFGKKTRIEMTQAWAMVVAMSFQKQTRRVSASFLIDELKELCSNVSQAESNLSLARDERNRALVELKALGLPERTLVKLTNLSPASIKKITAGARRHAEALLIDAALL